MTPSRVRLPSLAVTTALALLATGCGSSGSPTLSSIAVGPTPITMPAGASLQLTGTGTWSDGSTSDLGTQAAWTSSDPLVASVSSAGLLTGHAAGSVTVTATSAGVTATAPATVTPPALTSLAVSPATIAMPPWATGQLTATATYSDGSTADVSAQAAWSSSAAATATVTAGGLLAIPSTATQGASAIVTATLSDKSATATASVTTANLAEVVVMPRSGDIVAGETLRLSAWAFWSDDTAEDVTGRATWTAATPTVVAVDSTGLAAANGKAVVGAFATVSASFAGKRTDSSLRVVRGAPIGPFRTSDPLAPQEWYLLNVGQNAFADSGGMPGVDLHLQNAYAMGLLGRNVKVAVVDSGLEIKHEDLEKNVVEGSWNFVTRTNDPTPAPNRDWYEAPHGTAVAGIVAMVYDNGIGGMGVAPGATLNGYNYLAAQSYLNLIKSLGGSAVSPKSDDVWIFNQSTGTSAVAPTTMNSVVAEQYRYGVDWLREGRGAIYVKSAGNGFRGFGVDPYVGACGDARNLGVTCQNASYDATNVLPYNIVVGSLNASGTRASYSTAGSALWISAPGGEYGNNKDVNPGKAAFVYQPAMVTTDLSNCELGYAWNKADDSSFNQGGPNNPSCRYTNTFNGTSSAAPSVTGAIALLLDARPDLGWRDVKHILASTARKVDPSRAAVIQEGLAAGDRPGQGSYVAELPWITNDAGYSFHNWYGFGAIDVDSAVEMARTHAVDSLGQFRVSESWGGNFVPRQRIKDANSEGAVHRFTPTLTPAIKFIEAVQIYWSATHPRMSDLGVKLWSPKGTVSILLNIKGGFTTQIGPSEMALLTNAFYGEDPNGEWTIEVVDGRAGEEGTFDGFWIQVYGH